MTADTLFGASFWTIPGNWSSPAWDDIVWTFTEDKLPVLKGLAGQNGDGGLYLTTRDIQYAAVQETGYTYTGEMIYPTVIFDGQTLVKDTDYTVSITSMDDSGTSAGTNTGTVAVTLSGKGNFTGEKTGATYTIGKANGSLTISCISITYGGMPDPQVINQTGNGAVTYEYKVQAADDNTYTAIVPVNAGSYTVRGNLAETANYNAATATANFTILPKTNAVFTIAAIPDQTYTGYGLMPEPEVKVGSTVLIKGVDFNYQYSDNVNAGATSLVSVIGIGSYAGSIGSATFTITRMVPDITAPPAVSGTVYTGTALSQISLTGGIVNVSGHFEWVNPTAAAVFGSNTFEARFVPEDTLLYTEVSGINVTFNAVNRCSGGSSSDNDISDSRNTTIIPAAQPNQPTTASVNATARVINGNAALIITDSMAKAAIEKALANAKINSNTANGISVDISVTATGATGCALTLERTALNRLLEADVKSFSIFSLPVNMSFDTAALKQLQTQSGGNLIITVKPVTVTGLRSAYNVTISATKAGEAINISSLGTGTSTLSILVEPGKNELSGYFYGAYVGADKKINQIADSAYDANSRRMILSADHFSVYGVGYTAPSEKFTDTANHWAKDSIDYVVGRGLLSGTSETTFTLNTAMTRGMLVTALGRRANVDTKAYTTNSFTDVKADSAFRAYIEWAYKTGIMMGGTGGKFNPKSSATRAEVSAMLTRYVKLTIDLATAQGWAKNDAGQYLYYQDGKALTGEQTIDSVKYFFYTTGILQTGWVQNGGSWYYYSGNKQFTGWCNIGSGEGKQTYYLDTYGNMMSGKWVQIEGKWYYFYADGTLAKSTKIDGYEIDENGVRKTK